MSLQPTPRFTPEEYLELERNAAYKSEYLDGEIFAMAGATESHISIVGNLIYLLVGQFKGRDCKAYSNDMKVRVTATGLFTYPDVVMLCGEARFHDQQKDVLWNPGVIIEVLSDSTEAYDRGKKFEHYSSIESLSDYLLVAQDRPKIEQFVRQPDQKWLYSAKSGIDAGVEIPSINCVLLLAEVYDKVDVAR